MGAGLGWRLANWQDMARRCSFPATGSVCRQRSVSVRVRRQGPLSGVCPGQTGSWKECGVVRPERQRKRLLGQRRRLTTASV